ncbi:MAG: hypothetical protein ABS35_02540 [Kaistia sp. SCN 65-12]|nr:MAG: hypothetical protein ABS35_02540 [Kaistia sp. SCN 65-12]
MMMEELDDILGQATAAIHPTYFLLPVAGRLPALRERVYCYELYHQMRVRWPPNAALSLSGEIDKRGHEVLAARGARLAIPDLLVHSPGNMDNNHAILEVKSIAASRLGIRKDLGTLSEFQNLGGYNRGIYLFYGGAPIDVVMDEYARLENRARIEIWAHDEPGAAAVCYHVCE